MIALVVLTMIWMYRLASNHRALQRNGTWAPGWAIGGWFLPPGALYIIPYLMFRELWKASDPAVPAGDQRWKENRVGPVVTVWWVLYGLAPIPLAIAQGLSDFSARTFSGDTETLAEAIDDRFTITLVTSLVAAAAAVAYIVMVRQLSRPPPSADGRVGAADLRRRRSSAVVDVRLDLGTEALDQVAHVGGRPTGEALVDVRQRHLRLAEEAVLDDPEKAERIGVRGIELGRPRQLRDRVEEQVSRPPASRW